MTESRYRLRSAGEAAPDGGGQVTLSGDGHDEIERLRSWQLAAYLTDQHEIWFETDDGHAAVAELFPGREHVFRSARAAESRPDPEFAWSPLVEGMLGPLRALMSGSVEPVATAAAILELLDEATVATPAVEFRIDDEVLTLLRDLIARREQTDYDPYRAYRGPEWQWLQECVRLVMLQVGRTRPGDPPRAALTMASFRTEL